MPRAPIGDMTPEAVDADEVAHYGGFLIAESIAAENRALIVAAPDMYEALERIVDLVDEAYQDEPVSRMTADVVARNSGRIARTVLRKARGETGPA
jgi:hypothetical protein